jgi:hypothetical protein
MTENKNKDTIIVPKNDWGKARPETLPKPTYWPFFLAMGLAFLFWGLLTTWVVLAAGGLIFITALIGWINQIRHE